jgi:hypothetical protein
LSSIVRKISAENAVATKDSDNQLQKLVDRLLQSNKPETDTPGALVSAVVDMPMER